jgi:CHAT domain-containing protein
MAAGSQPAPGEALARVNQPSLVMSLLGDLQNEDGFLTMGEIIDNLDFSAELVAVTAGPATPASGEASDGEGLAGLARSLLYAGARKLLLSQWKVEPLTTRSLVADTFLQLRKSGSAMAALEESRARIRAGTIKLGDGIYSQAHPYFWASFLLMGD